MIKDQSDSRSNMRKMYAQAMQDEKEQLNVLLAGQTIAQPIVSGSLPERRDKFLSDLKKLQEYFNLSDIEFQNGYYAGFEDGCNAIIDLKEAVSV